MELSQSMILVYKKAIEKELMKIEEITNEEIRQKVQELIDSEK